MNFVISVLLGHRIEPLTTDLLLDTNSESPVYQTDGIDEAAGQSAVHITEVGEYIHASLYCHTKLNSGTCYQTVSF